MKIKKILKGQGVFNLIKKTLKGQGGFTLIEMLIVVAIIAILVAVAIPMVNKNLEKARIATDEANVRAAKAAAMLDYISDTPAVFSDKAFHKFNIVTGDFKTAPGEGYGKSSATTLTGCTFDSSKSVTTAKDNVIQVKIEDGVAAVEWTTK